MPSRLAPFLCSLVFGALVMSVAPANGLAASAPVACAGATSTTTATGFAPVTSTINSGEPPSADAPDGACWTDVEPYPFGAEGEAVNSSNCPFVPESIEASTCYLTVTSMAFRAWNRGVAATTERSGGGQNKGANPYGVWLFNGDHWFPTPGFPGSKVCSGHTVVWAGKLDYWLVGGSPAGGHDEWARLCRFDGESLEWEPLSIPTATKEHVLERIEVEAGQEVLKLRPGTITSAACFAWNNCWFFGTYGTVIHWDGKKLHDASPERSQSSLQGEYTGAVAREGLFGEPLGLAVGATSEGGAAINTPLPGLEGTAPPQLYGSSGGAFAPLAFTPPTTPLPGDPYRTDLIGVDVDPAGQGWAAGNPAGLRLGEREGLIPGEPSSLRANELLPSPLVPLSTSGPSTTCVGPPAERFTYTPPSVAAAEVFLWSSIAVLPNGEASGEALAGGRWRRAEAGSSQRVVEESGEPVIARANCAGTTTVTRFVAGHEPPPDHEGAVSAVAANAANDAWAATSRGEFGAIQQTAYLPPHLYRLTNGRPPEAPEGNDEEPIREVPELDKPTIVIEPPQPEPPPQAPVVTPVTKSTTLPAAVYDVKAKLHTIKRHGHLYLSLYLTFKLRRSVKIGAQALRHGHVVSVAKPRLFKGHTGLLILKLNRKHWPTNVHFIS